MKKLFALLLALMMVLSLAACGGDETPSGNEDNPPSSGQQQEQNTPDPDEGEDEPDNSGEALAWPSDISSVEWTGSGKVVGIKEVAGSSHGEVEIYIDVASLDEVGAYIDMLKGNGVTYHGEGDEPALSFEDGEYEWAGNFGAIKISLLEEPDTRKGVEGTYQLIISVFSDQF